MKIILKKELVGIRAWTEWDVEKNNSSFSLSHSQRFFPILVIDEATIRNNPDWFEIVEDSDE